VNDWDEMLMSIFEKNVNAIKKRFPHVYAELVKARSDDSYLGVEKAKNGEYFVPILFNGKALHSKYSHTKESEKMFSGREETVLFCGIGAGYHIMYFLHHFPGKKALLTDCSYSSFRRLLELCDISEILLHKDVMLLPPYQDASFISCFVQTYLPILMGNLSIIILRVWRDLLEGDTTLDLAPIVSSNQYITSSASHTTCSSLLDEKIKLALSDISCDLSTQAKFGRIWMRNIFLNLQLLSSLPMRMLEVDAKKRAYILGAGPSLQDKIDEIKREREHIVIFASDASFLPLLKNGIHPDFFISIDPQIACSTHCITSFPADIVGVFDLAASPPLARQFAKNGNRVVFTTTHHPFSQYVSAFSHLPFLDVRGGTVAIAALNLAFSLGFVDFETAGLDFAYTCGAPYTKGVYLHEFYQKDVNKLMPEETHFSSLMFRSSLQKVFETRGITYRSELLDSYKRAFEQKEKEWEKEKERVNKRNVWMHNHSSFPYEAFMRQFKNEAKTLYEAGAALFLPFITWQKMSKRCNAVEKSKDDSFLSCIESFFSSFT